MTNEAKIKLPHEVPTDRLILRSARSGDGAALRLAIGSSLKEFFPWLSFSARLDDEEILENVSKLANDKFNDGEFYVWRAWEPNGLLIGSVDLHSINHAVPSCQIGYWIRSDRSGKGLASEFVLAAIKVAHESLQVERIEARCDERNEPSCRLVERLGLCSKVLHEMTTGMLLANCVAQRFMRSLGAR